ncbi:hypothetical protein DXU03_18855 [Rhizobium johnstonii]
MISDASTAPPSQKLTLSRLRLFPLLPLEEIDACALAEDAVFRAEATRAIFDRQALRYDLILAQPTPPPSIGKADVMRGCLTPNRLFEHLA